MSGVQFTSQRVLVPQGNVDPYGASGLPPLLATYQESKGEELSRNQEIPNEENNNEDPHLPNVPYGFDYHTPIKEEDKAVPGDLENSNTTVSSVRGSGIPRYRNIYGGSNRDTHSFIPGTTPIENGENPMYEGANPIKNISYLAQFESTPSPYNQISSLPRNTPSGKSAAACANLPPTEESSKFANNLAKDRDLSSLPLLRQRAAAFTGSYNK